MKPIDLPPDTIADAVRADLARPKVIESISKADATDDQHSGTHPPHPPHVDPPDVPALEAPPTPPPGDSNMLQVAQQIAHQRRKEEREASTRIAIQNSTRTPVVPE
jgi:hypothetical protein